MSKAKKPLTQAQKDKAARYKANVKALKKAGLTNVDLRTHKPSRYMEKLIKQYSDVIAGNAVSVKVPAKARKELRENYRVQNGRAVVAKPQLGGKAKWNAKHGEIVTTAKIGDTTVYSVSRRFNYEQLKKFNGVPGVQFAIAIRRGSTVEWHRGDLAYIENLVGDGTSMRNFMEWYNHVSVEFVSGKGRVNPLLDLPDADEGEPEA